MIGSSLVDCSETFLKEEIRGFEENLTPVLHQFLQDNPGFLAVVSDFDADGLSAAVLMERFLQLHNRDFELRTPDKARNVWDTPPERWLPEKASAAIVMDLGCRGDKLFQVPTLFIDHHSYDPPSEGDLLVTGYDRTVVPCTAGLVWELVGEELPAYKWLAAVGTYGDLGSKAPFDYLQETKSEFTAKALGETVALLNAARRVSPPRIELALEALREHQNPKQFASGRSPLVKQLVNCRKKVQKETAQGKRAAPRFSEDVALIEVSSECQIHPVVAQIWRTRLPKYYVIVANHGYEPERVHFSGRSSGNMKILEKLRSLPCWSRDAGFGQGHDKAAGGVVGPELWGTILNQLGFTD